MNRHCFMGWVIRMTLAVLCAAPVYGAPTTVNGDFELGNVGFTSGYNYSPGDLWVAQTYTVDTDPANNHPLAVSYGDHTSGSGNMLIVNGSTLPSVTVWQESVSVEPFTQYVFSYYLSRWSGYYEYPAQLEASVNGVSIGSVLTPTYVATWIQVSHAWGSADTTSADIRLVDTSLWTQGNDFAIDDISLTAVPASGALALGAIGAGLAGWLRRRRAL